MIEGFFCGLNVLAWLALHLALWGLLHQVLESVATPALVMSLLSLIIHVNLYFCVFMYVSLTLKLREMQSAQLRVSWINLILQ